MKNALITFTIALTILYFTACDSSETTAASTSHQVSEPTPNVSKKRTPEEKLDFIVLPDVRFQNNSLREAIQIVRDLSTQSDPDGHGVDIALTIPEGMTFDENITAHLQTPTLRAAFEAIASKYNLEIVPRSYAIGLVPKTK